jgi:hypothetical protein
MDLEAVIGGAVECGLIPGDESSECHVVDAEGKMLAPLPRMVHGAGGAKMLNTLPSWIEKVIGKDVNVTDA